MRGKWGLSQCEQVEGERGAAGRLRHQQLCPELSLLGHRAQRTQNWKKSIFSPHFAPTWHLSPAGQDAHTGKGALHDVKQSASVARH